MLRCLKKNHKRFSMSIARPLLPRILLLLCAFAAPPAHAADWDLLSIGVRAQVWEKNTLGRQQPEGFEQYDLTAAVRIPWEGRSGRSWSMSARLLGSMGALRSADYSGFVASAIPAVAFAHGKVPVSVDFGVGLALLSRYRFRDQDYGGPLQFAVTLGIGVPVHRRVGIGYRFLHYSDARLYGSHTVGADFHMLEFNYLF